MVRNGFPRAKHRGSLPAFLISFLPLFVRCLQAEAILYQASPASVKPFHHPYHSYFNVKYLNSDYSLEQNEPIYAKQPAIVSEKVFQIEPSDAIDGIKYSQPAVSYNQPSSYPRMKVPLSTHLKDRIFPVSAQHTISESFQDQIFTPSEVSQNSPSKPMRDVRYLESLPENNSPLTETMLESEYKIPEDSIDNVFQSNMELNGGSSSSFSQDRNNFTDESDHLLPISSDSVLSYESPSPGLDDGKSLGTLKRNVEETGSDMRSLYSDVSKVNYSDSNLSTFSVMKDVVTGLATESSVIFNTHLYSEFTNQTDSTENTAATIIISSGHEDENISSSSASFDNESEKWSSGTVAGIVIAVLVCVTILSSAVIYLLYRKYNGKCTSVVESKFNSDNCGYLDDSLRSSIYLNNHIELPKENSEEMTSLDNDSFLNSLETMTIQNYWADNSKNTKV